MVRLRGNDTFSADRVFTEPVSGHDVMVGRVIVVPHDPSWAVAFTDAAAEVATAWGSNLLEIHHVGSTSIPGIYAKPIIDMLAVVSDIAAVDGKNPQMQSVGYVAKGEYGIPGRRFLYRNDSAGVRTDQIHAFQRGSPHIARHLAFRDFLRVHTDVALSYSDLKRRLAAAHPRDIEAYMDGKDGFIKDVEVKALVWVARRPSASQTVIHQRVAAAGRGENPTVVCRMRSGYLVMSDQQTPRGWCILLSVPVVADLDDLDEEQRTAFLSDMAAAGEVIKHLTGAQRINYSMLGNVEPALHAHIQPRFADEPEHLRRQPLWAIWDQLEIVTFDAAREAPLMAEIRRGLAAMGRCE
jgi:GrpB-like predicted nucleotidyltransferase (UPF0157 family)/diadenosine tetraphosphate (Ap4A) HIT family hydrolase